MPDLKIAGGRVIDPANDINDAVRDLWIENGAIIAAPSDRGVRAIRTIDARGMVVMPGGVDMHCHIVGSKVTAGRALLPESLRRENLIREPVDRFTSKNGPVPDTHATGVQYAGLGYTTAIDAAIAPLGARQAIHEFRDVPCIDKAFLVLLGNHHYVMDQIRKQEWDRLVSFVAWVLQSTRALGVKVVNPGGIEEWKQGRGNVSTLDDRVDSFDVTPRRILQWLAQAVDQLGLSHPIHVHCNNLGLPGNWATTLDTLKTLDGFRSHLTHIQYHSYGGSIDKPTSIRSKVPELAEYVNAHANVSVDVGQIVFGETVSMTADGAVGEYLHGLTGRKWLSHDVEFETGCGVVPIRYEEKSLVHSTQWAIGLEWFLRVEDPWRIALSTDHPNGGSFLSYPQIIALLMDGGLRRDFWKRLPERVARRSGLNELTREYSLAEIATVTRAAPARILGLARKGHLRPGADADITIYQPDTDIERMFARPRYVIKAGFVMIDDGDLKAMPTGRLHHATASPDPGTIGDIREWFERSSTIEWSHFPVAAEELLETNAVGRLDAVESRAREQK